MTDTTLTEAAAVTQVAEQPAVVAPAVEAPAAPAAEVAAKPAAEAAQAEITYTDFTLPEGFDAKNINTADVTSFAKELGLNQDQAQKLVDRVIKQRSDFEATQATTQADVVAGWAVEAKADPEIGGDKFDASLAAAVSVINNPKLVNPEFKAFLDASGLGNHPEMIRTFARIAPVFANDTPVPGGGGAPAGDPVKGLYSNSNHN